MLKEAQISLHDNSVLASVSTQRAITAFDIWLSSPSLIYDSEIRLAGRDSALLFAPSSSELAEGDSSDSAPVNARLIMNPHPLPYQEPPRNKMLHMQVV
jgi:hypothetical protein